MEDRRKGQMIFLKKALAFLKNYWYIPLVLLAFALGFFYFSGGGTKRLKEIFYAAKARYIKDKQAIENTHREKEQKKKQTVIKHGEDVKKAGEEKEKAMSDLEEEKQQSIKDKTERYNEDPDSFTEEISEFFNFSIFGDSHSNTSDRPGEREKTLHKESEEGGEGSV
jgi:hypothetical protein